MEGDEKGNKKMGVLELVLRWKGRGREGGREGRDEPLCVFVIPPYLGWSGGKVGNLQHELLLNYYYILFSHSRSTPSYDNNSYRFIRCTMKCYNLFSSWQSRFLISLPRHWYLLASHIDWIFIAQALILSLFICYPACFTYYFIFPKFMFTLF